MRIDKIGRSELPVSMEIVKAHLRVEFGAEAIEEMLLDIYTRGAVAEVEKATRRTVARQRFRLEVDAAAVIVLPVYPVVSIESVTSPDGLVSPDDYDLRADLLPQELRFTTTPAGPLVIELTAGHTAETLPDDLADLAGAILLGVGHRYEHRESVAMGVSVAPLPLAFKDICWANRVAL